MSHDVLGDIVNGSVNLPKVAVTELFIFLKMPTSEHYS